MMCDQVIAAEPARFVSPYPALGASPDFGLTHTLTARLGPRRARSLALDTRSRALALGVIDELAAYGELERTALALGGYGHISGTHRSLRAKPALRVSSSVPIVGRHP
jgi:enoyl-CoA hydratase/carnithine racemase